MMNDEIVFEPIEITFEPIEKCDMKLSLFDPVIEELEDEYFDRLEVDP